MSRENTTVAAVDILVAAVGVAVAAVGGVEAMSLSTSSVKACVPASSDSGSAEGDVAKMDQ